MWRIFEAHIRGAADRSGSTAAGDQAATGTDPTGWAAAACVCDFTSSSRTGVGQEASEYAATAAGAGEWGCGYTLLHAQNWQSGEQHLNMP